MSEYIKKEDAIKEIKEWATNLLDPRYIVREDAECALMDLPSADVVEVRHGKWIDDEGQQILLKNAIDKGENWKVCSICGAGMCIGAKYKTDKVYHRHFSRYCPNCGARMDGEEKENE